MRIFVIGTGRCGTVTFSKACQHITNYTSGHETTGRLPIKEKLTYPDNHIEIDPSLSYFIPLLREKYPDALFVHLQRERESCVDSLMKRQSLYSYAGFHLRAHHTECSKNMRLIAEIYYDNTNELIKKILNENRIFIPLEMIDICFSLDFWVVIEAEGNKEKALSELEIKYNKS
jgi:hypothetical protein